MSVSQGRDADLSVWLPLVESTPVWMERGACRRGKAATSVFFVTDQKRRRDELVEAKAWCAGCVVSVECLAYALARPALYGVWGGTTESQRQRMRRRARRAQSLQTS